MIRDLIYGDVAPTIYAGLNKQNTQYKIKGWMSTVPIFKDLIDRLRPKLIVEVGSWLGLSAIYMALIAKQHKPNVEIVCIDTFLGSQEMWDQDRVLFKPLPFNHGRPTVYEQFLSNVVHKDLQHIITPFPIDSKNGAIVLQRHNVQADLIYIDGGHDYETCKNDIVEYLKILRPGGVMLVDDIHHEPVQNAILGVIGHDEVAKGRHADNKFYWVHTPF